MSALYLDPSLGGVCGLSLTRFLIWMFPDPITEGLTFWKIVHQNNQMPNVRLFPEAAANPDIANFVMEHLDKLLDSPVSRNIRKNISVVLMLKQEIKKTMQENLHKIQNQINYLSQISRTPYKKNLYSINPLFPRFIGEFKSAIFFGIVQRITGLFGNSRTIRNEFKARLSQKINQIMIDSELSSIKMLELTTHTGARPGTAQPHYDLGDVQ